MSVRAIQHVEWPHEHRIKLPHTLLCEDNRLWQVRFRNEPMGTRGLINEAIAYMLLDYLDLSIPTTCAVTLPSNLLEVSPKLVIPTDYGAEPCAIGRNLGITLEPDSLYGRYFSYIFRRMYPLVINLPEFIGMICFDKWLANAAARRVAIHGSRKWERADPYFQIFDKWGHVRTDMYVAKMIDHRHAFGGSRWLFVDEPGAGIFESHLVYRRVRHFDSFSPWLDKIVSMPPVVLDVILKQIPEDWIDKRQDNVERLLEQLYARRKMVPDLVRACKSAPVDPFPGWR